MSLCCILHISIDFHLTRGDATYLSYYFHVVFDLDEHDSKGEHKNTTIMRTMKRKLTGRQQKPQQVSDDRPRPPAVTEDIFLRNGIPFKQLSMQDDKLSSPPSKGSSSPTSHNSFVTKIGSNARASKPVLVMKVVVPAGLAPGKNVKLRYIDGSEFRARVPPRDQWSFENCDGEPRAFFLVLVDTGERPLAPPPSTESVPIPFSLGPQ